MVQCVGNAHIGKGEVTGQGPSLLDSLRHAKPELWSLVVFQPVCSHNVAEPALEEIRLLHH
ncbi:MAG: hypothetical protein MPJ27_03335 [Pirellulales bacterium]|nr:hypothetical protein [Pirellulales bacterium]